MDKSIHTSGIDWPFLKGDHASAYKQLPLDPKYANLTVVALRHPASGRWVGFVPKVLLFGAASAVLHYNCFPRSLAVAINRYFGIPLSIYYVDFGGGGFSPFPLAERALSVFSAATTILGSDLNDDKSKFGKKLKFLGLTVEFPQRSSGMTLFIYLPDDKIAKWASLVEEIISLGPIQRKPSRNWRGSYVLHRHRYLGASGGLSLNRLTLSLIHLLIVRKYQQLNP